MNKRIKILHIIAGMGTGGAEKDIINWYRSIDRNKFQFDFLIRTNEMFYKDEIEQYGGKIIRVSEFPRKLIKNYFETKEIISRGEYDCVHVHGNALIYIIPLIIAKKCGVKKRIMHIHNTKANGIFASIIHYFNRLIIKKYATDCFACSKKAGEFGYKRNYCVINNAINDEFFNAHNDIKKYRNIYRIDENAYVIGHIGRFIKVKNHKFIIDVFYHYNIKNPNSYLMLAGSGQLQDSIKDYVNKCNLKDNVIFLNDINDVQELINSVDIVLLPSLYEGIPLVSLESQAMKKKIILSSNIDDTTIITPYAYKLDLSLGAKYWANYIDELSNDMNEYDTYAMFNKKNYLLKNVIKQLENVYYL